MVVPTSCALWSLGRSASLWVLREQIGTKGIVAHLGLRPVPPVENESNQPLVWFRSRVHHHNFQVYSSNAFQTRYKLFPVEVSNSSIIKFSHARTQIKLYGEEHLLIFWFIS